MKARPRLLWFALGAGFMATLALPIVGALGSMFWTMQSQMRDGKADDTRAAERVVAWTDGNWDVNSTILSSHQDRPDTGDTRHCLDIFVQDLGSRPLDFAHHPGLEAMIGAIIGGEQRLDENESYRIATRPFLALPRPVLGALAQCVGRTVLSPVCAAYAQRRLETADPSVKRDIGAALLENAKRGDDEACLLLDIARHIAPHAENEAQP